MAMMAGGRCRPQAFGEFVAGDKVVVGLVIFVIIVLIQFIVITKGATRYQRKWPPRFCFGRHAGPPDGPSTADLNAGVIDEKRSPIPPRRDYPAGRLLRGYGRCQQVSSVAMQIAGIIITLINIVGGPVHRRDRRRHGKWPKPPSLFHNAYDRRRPGQPGGRPFLISLAAGLLTTRSSSEVNLPAEFLVATLFRVRSHIGGHGWFLGVF